jgi:hypothetical protein
MMAIQMLTAVGTTCRDAGIASTTVDGRAAMDLVEILLRGSTMGQLSGVAGSPVTVQHTARRQGARRDRLGLTRNALERDPGRLVQQIFRALQQIILDAQVTSLSSQAATCGFS